MQYKIKSRAEPGSVRVQFPSFKTFIALYDVV